MADLDATLEELHKKLAEALLKSVQDGSATASELSVARQFLKDNAVTAPPGTDDNTNALGALMQQLADYDGDDNVVPLVK